MQVRYRGRFPWKGSLLGIATLSRCKMFGTAHMLPAHAEALFLRAGQLRVTFHNGQAVSVGPGELLLVWEWQSSAMSF